MKLTEILYEDVKDIWDGYLKHPFVSGIGDEGSQSWYCWNQDAGQICS